MKCTRMLCLAVLLLITLLESACGPGKMFGPTLTPTPTITFTPTNTPLPTDTPPPPPTFTPVPTVPAPPTLAAPVAFPTPIPPTPTRILPTATAIKRCANGSPRDSFILHIYNNRRRQVVVWIDGLEYTVAANDHVKVYLKVGEQHRVRIGGKNQLYEVDQPCSEKILEIS